MVDHKNKQDGSLPEIQQDNLISQIDELEKLLAEKKAEAREIQQQHIENKPVLPRLNVGTDGIPVLVKTVNEENFFTENEPAKDKKDGQFINEIIDKIDKEITEDLDELIVMLKDSIIDEVKTRLLKELKTNKKNSNEK